MAVAGIHFGNTNSVITVSKDTKIETVSNETGDRVTPTIVAYTGTEKVIGQPAKQYIIRNPLSCISNIKAAVGGNFSEEDIAKMKNDFSCEVTNKNGKIVFKVKVDSDTVSVRSSEAASYIFTKLLEIAESVGGSDLEDVVLTVPATFSEEQRILLSKAAESVGCNVLRLISEPAAALLSFGIGQDNPTIGCAVLVFRLGGTSMDATIMKVNSGMYRFIGQKVKQDFGAKKFDEAMVKYLVEEFRRKSKEDISDNKRAVGKLKAAIEECKHALTNMTSSHFAVESLYDGIDFSSHILRAKFDSICNNLFTECMKLVDDLLLSQSITENEIDKVVFVGGGSRMPRLISMFKQKFKNSEILNNINPEEVLARGAALQASLLTGREDIVLDSTVCGLDCLSKNIGLKVIDDDKEKLDVIIPKHTPIPTRRSKIFEGHSEQTSVCISIFESEDLSLDCATCLAKIAMKDLPADKEKAFNLTFEINRTGSLVATLTEKNSNNTEHVTIPMHSS